VAAVVVLDAGECCQQGRNYSEANGAEDSGTFSCKDPFQGPGRGSSHALEMT
jgi:hypothetical protein